MSSKITKSSSYTAFAKASSQQNGQTKLAKAFASSTKLSNLNVSKPVTLTTYTEAGVFARSSILKMAIPISASFKIKSNSFINSKPSIPLVDTSIDHKIMPAFKLANPFTAARSSSINKPVSSSINSRQAASSSTTLNTLKSKSFTTNVSATATCGPIHASASVSASTKSADGSSKALKKSTTAQMTCSYSKNPLQEKVSSSKNSSTVVARSAQSLKLASFNSQPLTVNSSNK